MIIRCTFSSKENKQTINKRILKALLKFIAQFVCCVVLCYIYTNKINIIFITLTSVFYTGI